MGALIETSASALKPFDGERGHLAEELAFDADRAVARGDVAASIVLYAQAAELEEKTARDVPATSPRARAVLATSAAVLWVKAGKQSEADRITSEFNLVLT